jgi:DNA-directed RNA polymerase specialized sigma24 family protein
VLLAEVELVVWLARRKNAWQTDPSGTRAHAVKLPPLLDAERANWFETEFLPRLAEAGCWSDRQRRVMSLRVRGRSVEEVAEHLTISTGTARWHEQRARERLGATCLGDLFRIYAAIMANTWLAPTFARSSPTRRRTNVAGR